jgi:TfoX/Sxy family transcriptional regulator of competence genes
MQYYSEEKMHDFRVRIEKEVLSWPHVTIRKMYGCPCYKNNEKLFAFLVTDGVVLTKASEQDKITLSKEFDTKLFQAGKRTISKWPQILVNETTDLDKILTFVKNSYDEAAMP